MQLPSQGHSRLLTMGKERANHRKRRRKDWQPVLILVVVLACLPQIAFGMFGLPSKRFRYEGLINAGSLGLDNFDGQVAAFGDWNADSAVDLFTISSDGKTIQAHLWDHAKFAFVTSPSARILAPSDSTFIGIVPADFNYDGRLDLLAMLQSPHSNSETQMLLYTGTQDGTFDAVPIAVNASSSIQPMALDATGDMHIDLLGHLPDSRSKLSVWRNTLGQVNQTQAFVVEDAPLASTSKVPSCQFAEPHSSAFIDLNGDCLADLFLVCKDPGFLSSGLTFQIWTANPNKSGYTLARHGTLPHGTGALTFADMDRDGTIDVVFPSCDGDRGPCHINIAYNRQMPLCSEKRDDWFGVGPGGASTSNNTVKCRDTDSNLCTADDTFSFDFTVSPNNDKMTRIPLSDIANESLLLLNDNLIAPAMPIPLTLGDFNRDGYPDIAIITVPNSGQRDETRLRLLESTSCAGYGRPKAGCPAQPNLRRTQRTFRMLTDNVEAIDVLNDVRSVSFFDLDEDGSLDLLVQRRALGGSNQRQITFVQNNFFFDAFFLKAMTSNGACSSYCEPSAPGKSAYRPWGVNYNGASYKFTVLDTNGIRRPQQVGQLSQTAYRALQLPYAYFGLGRTNNYVESLFVGVTRRRLKNYRELEGVIPNSQVVILPWEPRPNDPTSDTSTWQRELYLSPGDWIPWVTIALATIVVMLLGVVFVLHLHERREDERERKRAVHAINFDAL